LYNNFCDVSVILLTNAKRQISEMNASVAVVIVGEERNMTLSWTTNYPPVLLTDELSLSDDKCNNFGRFATKGTVRHVMAFVSVVIQGRSSSIISLSSTVTSLCHIEHGNSIAHMAAILIF